jgi:hypothetical protein
MWRPSTLLLHGGRGRGAGLAPFYTPLPLRSSQVGCRGLAADWEGHLGVAAGEHASEETASEETAGRTEGTCRPRWSLWQLPG